MKTHILFCALLCLLGVARLRGQAVDLRVVAAAGVANGQHAFTIGETFVTLRINGNIMLTEGFHQPATSPVAVQGAIGAFAIELFPSPTVDDATLRIQSLPLEQLHVQLIDLLGQVVWEAEWPMGLSTLSLPLAQLASASYFVRVSNRTNKQHTTLRVEKIAY